MRLFDEQCTKTPFYDVTRLTAWLREQEYTVNPKWVVRQMGLAAIYSKPKTTRQAEVIKKYPYLLKGVTFRKPNQV